MENGIDQEQSFIFRGDSVASEPRDRARKFSPARKREASLRASPLLARSNFRARSRGSFVLLPLRNLNKRLRTNFTKEGYVNFAGL